MIWRVRSTLLALTAVGWGFLTLGIPAEATEAEGKIKNYECGDNCYLTLSINGADDLTGLCSAKACADWNEKTEMPKKFIGKKVRVTVETGQQTDADGNVMGDFPSITNIEFIKK